MTAKTAGALAAAATVATAAASAWAIVAAVASGCSDEPAAHVYSGRGFEEARGCLDTVTSLDVVDGPQPAAPCDPKCLVAPPDPDAGTRAVYVSTMCAPYPPTFDTSGGDARCAAALAAYAANVTCLADGGVANAPDAASAANDAAPDANDASDAAANDASDAAPDANDASDAAASDAASD